MYKLYKTHDLSLLMEKNLYPFLTRKICNYDYGWSDINSLRCADKALNNIIIFPITKCKKIKIVNKRVCSVHCRAMPIYRYLQKRLKKYDSRDPVIIFIHFHKKPLANLFKSLYGNRIRRGAGGKLRQCCGGKGFALILNKKQRERVMLEGEKLIEKINSRFGKE